MTPGYALLGILVAVSIAMPARADLITPDVGACQGKAKGDACADAGKAGACEASSCSKRDYTNGPPGQMVTIDCLRCVPGAKAAAAPTTAPKSSAKGAGCAIDAGAPTALGSLLLGASLLALARRRRS